MCAKIGQSKFLRQSSIVQFYTSLGVLGTQVCSNEGLRPFPRGNNFEMAKNTLTKFKNLLLQNHRANLNQTWHNASFGEGDSSLFK